MIIKNTFHNTSTKIRCKIGDIITETQYKRIMKRLCSVNDCCCGGNWGSGIRFEFAGRNEYREICYKITGKE